MDQASLFSSPQEKGSREWSAFNTVRDASPGMFRVSAPQQQPARRSVVAKSRTYYGQTLFPKPAH